MARQDPCSSQYQGKGREDDALRRAERLLFCAPVCLAVALGLGLMLVRFILVLGDNLRSSPDGWPAVMLLAVIVGGASLVIVAACAAAGAVVGLCLRALFAKGLAARCFTDPMTRHHRA